MAAAKRVQHPVPEERAAIGRRARAETPRSSHGAWEPAAGRPDPVSILEEQAKTRVPELVPLRHARMTVSPFTFYRGAAAVMAADLADSPVSGIRVQCCGDAHLSNFGGFAAPDRTLVFDINDFDETIPGPWEWDVKRLVASFEIAARAREFDDKVRRRVVETTARKYRTSMREYAAMRNLDLWYLRMGEAEVYEGFRKRLPATAVARVQANLTKSRRKDSMRAFAKLTTEVDGAARITNDPPLVVRIDDLVPEHEAGALRGLLQNWFRGYRQSLQPELRHLLETFELVDVARKVVGVGSVGTRCWIAFLIGRDSKDPLFLQIKEAEASVLEPYVGASTYTNHGRRVVEGQRLTQSAGDIFLGWKRSDDLTGTPRDFYVRQLWDGKVSAQVDLLEPEAMEVYGEICALTLARAHARSGDRIAIASYLGAGTVFERALVSFADTYADQNERDYETVVAAIHSGRLQSDAEAS